MAMSLETAAALAVLIEASGARRIADLGSGFSSFVVRKAAPDAEAWSVDDSDDWIEVTRAYLREQEVDTGQLLSWKEFLDRTQQMRFDLVFHDLGSMETRIATLADAIRLVKPGSGWLLLDDMHMIGYAPGAWPALREAGFATYSLRSLTIDSLSRFAVLARAH
jgi:predicted O-methyltransferase YrrM